MAASTIHIEPSASGRWHIRHDRETRPLSAYDSATEAERAAQQLARREGTSVALLLHDRYARVHPVPRRDPETPPSEPDTR